MATLNKSLDQEPSAASFSSKLCANVVNSSVGRPMFQSKIKTIVFGLGCLFLLGVQLPGYPHSNERTGRPRSYSGPNGHSLVIVSRAEFTMGSPVTERGRSQEEIQHRVRIQRTYAIATTEVTNEQFA